MCRFILHASWSNVRFLVNLAWRPDSFSWAVGTISKHAMPYQRANESRRVAEIKSKEFCDKIAKSTFNFSSKYNVVMWWHIYGVLKKNSFVSYTSQKWKSRSEGKKKKNDRRTPSNMEFISRYKIFKI